MNLRIAAALTAAALAAWGGGCSCMLGTCPPKSASGAQAASGPHAAADGSPAAVARNLADAEILVASVERSGGSSYAIHGRITGVAPAGGSASLAEVGQTLTLRPYYGEGPADPSIEAHRRLMDLSSTAPGSTIRCRITLDRDGVWRILSGE